MQKLGHQILYSASDIVNFLECGHLTSLDLRHLETPLPLAQEDEPLALVQAKGLEHERAYLEKLRVQGLRIVDVSEAGDSLEARLRRTEAAMREGAEAIYQAAFRHGSYVGHADFLLRVARPSALGGHGYEAADTKLARSPRAKFVVQLAFYSWLLGLAQGAEPRHMSVVLGNGVEQRFAVSDYAHYFRRVLAGFEAFVGAKGAQTYPEPCEKCAQCRWSALCDEQWQADDHLSQVANITGQQIRKLQAGGIGTLAQLGRLAPGAAVPLLEGTTLQRLRAQAALQLRAREEGGRYYELIPRGPEPGLRGFERMPRPDEGDMFFDMEGDPLEDGGLEYLFGVYVRDGGREAFHPFWAHNRREEKAAFERFMDFVVERLRRYPDAHIYHYAPYEETAIKRLMSVHGTREAEVDSLLRMHKLVDLYQVVREALRVSEPSYSIKSIEHFYRPRREGGVTNAGASIVFYERWRAERDERLLQAIEDYNRDDVVSTWQLREWLRQIRPQDLAWANDRGQQDIEAARFEAGAKTEAEARLDRYREPLLDGLPDEEPAWTADQAHRALVFQLLDFHRREQKPEWWAYFARAEASDAELVEDSECLGGLVRDHDAPLLKEGRSLRYTYRYPPQETKLRTGASCREIRGGQKLNKLEIDPRACTLSFTWAKPEPPPPRLAAGPDQPINNKVLADAVFRYADALLEAGARAPTRFRAVDALLRREAPRLHGVEPGRPLIDPGRPLLEQAVTLVAALDESALFVQGPPGAGKTYIGSRLLVHLLRQGKRVAVTSNSHHAINNLLAGVEKAAREQGFVFAGAKKSGAPGDDTCLGGDCIEDVFDNKKIDPARHQLVAGTAWLFSRPEMEGRFDYLFVDEAGQVSLANLVAVGLCARNIILLGDQMQLGQPTQGCHPGRSGESTLEYLLDGEATIAPDRGIFLDTSYRMHPAICGFVSSAIYDGRLRAAEATRSQRLALSAGADPALRESGIVYVPVPHEGNAQSSPEEARRVAALYASLRAQHYDDGEGRAVRLGADDVLVVAPYNVQVNALKAALPPDARVGTVDKFQGQEAQVVIISMATSSGATMPRDMEFLFSRNRLNVAISRAKSLAVLVASPALLSVRCRTPEQMALVNTLCWVAELGETGGAGGARGPHKTPSGANGR